MENEFKDNILWGLIAIADFLNLNEKTVVKLIALGLPAKRLNRRWCAHKDNLNQWFREYTSSE